MQGNPKKALFGLILIDYDKDRIFSSGWVVPYFDNMPCFDIMGCF